MRVVIDTNFWLSGLMLPSSIPGHIVRAASTADMTAILSEPMLQELRHALYYRRVRPRIPLSDEELERYLAELRYIGEIVDVSGTTARVPRDRRDDVILATYLASRADYLLTGDADLLALRPDHPILTAREFYEQHLLLIIGRFLVRVRVGEPSLICCRKPGVLSYSDGMGFRHPLPCTTAYTTKQHSTLRSGDTHFLQSFVAFCVTRAR